MSFQDVGVDRPRQQPQYNHPLPPRQPSSSSPAPPLYSSSSPLPQTHLQPSSRSHNQHLQQEHLLMPNWQQMTPPSTPPPPLSYARLHERARQTLAGASSRTANNASPAVQSNSGSSTSGGSRMPYGHTPPSPVATPPPSMYPRYSPQGGGSPSPPPPPPQHQPPPQQPLLPTNNASPYAEESYDEFPSIHPPTLIDAKTTTTNNHNNNHTMAPTTTTTTNAPAAAMNTATNNETDTYRSPPRRHLTPAAASASTGLFVLHGKVVDRTSLPVLHLHRPMTMEHDPHNHNNYNEEDVMSAASSITLDVLPSVQSNNTHPSQQQHQQHAQHQSSSYYSMSPERQQQLQQQQHQRLHLTAASNPAYSYVPSRLYEDPQPTGAYAPYQLPIQQPVQHHLHQQQQVQQVMPPPPQQQQPQMQRQVPSMSQPHLQQQQQQFHEEPDLLINNNNYQSNLANNNANDLNAIQQHIAARRARFSQLKSEILQFQNMVEELERTWPMTGESPETTWRARILWRSVEDANAELSQTLHDTEAELSHTPQARASFLQLYRDFRRVQRKYLMMSSRHLIEQQAQVTNLLFRQQQQQQQQQQSASSNNNNYTMKPGLATNSLQRASPATTVSSRSSLSRSQLQQNSRATPNTTSTASTSSMGNGYHYQQLQQDRSVMTSSPPPAWSHPMAPQQSQQQPQPQQVVLNSLSPPEGAEEDDFFVQAMREREQEVTNIQRSLRQVNEIYKELAGMVDIQQEQVDTVEGDIRYSRAATEVGLDHLQSANGGSNLVCSPMDEFSSTAAAAVTTVTTAASSPSAALAAALPNGLSLPSSLLMNPNDGSLCGAIPVDSLDDDDIVLDEDKSSLISLPRIEETSSVSSNEKDTKTKQRSSPLGPIEFSESEYDESLARNRRRRRRHRGSQNKESEVETDDLDFNCGKLDFPAIPKVLERVLEGKNGKGGGGDDAKQSDEASVTPSMLKERDFRWSMPFETFREDMKAVHKDILNLGKDTFRMMTSNEGLCQCGRRL